MPPRRSAGVIRSSARPCFSPTKELQLLDHAGVSNELSLDGLKDGTYLGDLTILSITTGVGGRQRAMFTSNTKGWNFGTTLEDGLVALTEATFIPGCFKLERVAITICPMNDDQQLIVIGYGEKQTLHRVA
ncbi:hypothetical protein FOZ60_014551 [Perkinsus olseni]|uniref:Uncharacterized protein n=1 Tax=Perkinsus olseni TaxID=32597 RepID=A0A7J6N7H4_PEROL|nr:hypothetical protein FOZ60_014551 [Perkinsus olseni]